MIFNTRKIGEDEEPGVAGAPPTAGTRGLSVAGLGRRSGTLWPGEFQGQAVWAVGTLLDSRRMCGSSRSGIPAARPPLSHRRSAGSSARLARCGHGGENGEQEKEEGVARSATESNRY
jgi:hypothetical protein